LDVEGIRREIDRFKYPVYIKKELRPPPPSIMEEERSRFPSISLWEALKKWGPPCLLGRIKLIDECCGTGGNSDALAACPWVEMVAACDFVPPASSCCEDAENKCPNTCRRWKHIQKFGSILEPLRTYRLNHSDHPALNQDVTDDVAMDALYAKTGATAAVGSTPCQDFTTLTEGKPNREYVGGVTYIVISRWVRQALILCVLENVPRMVDKPYDEWVEALKVWETTHIVVILKVFSSQVPPSGMNAIPVACQARERIYAIGILRSVPGAKTIANLLREMGAELATRPHATVGSFLPHVQPPYYSQSRNPRVEYDVGKPHVTLTCTCAYVPVKEGTRQKVLDKARSLTSWDQVYILSISDYCSIMGFQRNRLFHPELNRIQCGVQIGNAVTPCAMHWVFKSLANLQFFDFLLVPPRRVIPKPKWAWEFDAGEAHDGCPCPPRYLSAKRKAQKRVDTVWKRILPPLRRLKPILEEKVFDKNKPPPTGPPSWTIPPRVAPSPYLKRFRQAAVEAGQPIPSAAQDEAAGFGKRGRSPEQERVDGKFACLIDQQSLVDNVLRQWINADGQYDPTRSINGAVEPLCGRLACCLGDYHDSLASDSVMAGLACEKDGLPWEFITEPTPVAAGRPDGERNSPSCNKPLWQPWLYKSIAESCVLGILEEKLHRGFQTAPLACTSKGDWDPVLRPNRMRLLFDGRKPNLQTRGPPLRMETLDRVRDLLQPEDPEEGILTADFSMAFFHFMQSSLAMETAACMLGGRCLQYASTPMGRNPTPYLCQTTVWVLAKRWRRLGIRLMSYLDDFMFLVKKKYASLLATFIRGELRRHGWLLHDNKCYWDWSRTALALGTIIDLDRGLFLTPEKKWKDIVQLCKEAQRRALNRIPGPVRGLAQVVGKIMATKLSMGNIVRRMTRRSYAFIAKLTGVPPDTSRRELKVAWDLVEVYPLSVAKEMAFFIRNYPLNRGQKIRKVEPRAVLEYGSDAGKGGWGATMDAGLGHKHLARAKLPSHVAGQEVSSTLREAFGAAEGIESLEQVLIQMLKEMAVELLIVGATQAHYQSALVIKNDNQSFISALDIGSSTEAIQVQCERIWDILARHNIDGIYRWVCRDEDVIAFNDDQSKYNDTSDYMLDPTVFRSLCKRFGEAYTIDRFATQANRLCTLFNAATSGPGTTAPGCDVCAWTLHWRSQTSGELHNNWIHPPYRDIAEAIMHLRNDGARGTVLVPLNTRMLWWPLVRRGAAGVRDFVRIPRRSKLLWRYGTEPCKNPPRCDLAAVRFDFTAN
jgi:site-specific DNA-cytosine methylase